MKKIISALAITLLLQFTFAQSTHMTFKGIEIDGTRSEFSAKLVQDGFNILSQNEDAVILIGKFAGEDVTVAVLSTQDGTVWKVGVFFEETDSWMKLKYDYENFKKALTNKYGKGRSYEFFKEPYYEGDGYEMAALKMEKCVYSTFYDTENGSISLELSKFKHVTITYEDKINTEKKNQKKEQKYYDDL